MFAKKSFLVAAAAALAGCAASPWKRESIHVDQNVLLYREYEEVDGKVVPKGHSHPAILSGTALGRVFSGLRYVEERAFSDPVESDVLTASEAERLAAGTVEAMKRLGPDDRLRFLVRRSTWLDIFTSTSGVSGVLFSDGTGLLHLAFDRIGQPINDGDGDSPDEVVFPHDPLAFRDETPLLAIDGTRHHRDATSERSFPRWLEVDLAAVVELARRSPAAAPASAAGTAATPPDPSRELSGKTPPGGDAASPAPLERDPVERLKLLERLKAEGLISDEEYQEKREEILKGV